MLLRRQITKSAMRPAFAGYCANDRSFDGGDVCLVNEMQKLAISSRHSSGGVELTWRRT
jgi:hypothetical protein